MEPHGQSPYMGKDHGAQETPARGEHPAYNYGPNFFNHPTPDVEARTRGPIHPRIEPVVLLVRDREKSI